MRRERDNSSNKAPAPARPGPGGAAPFVGREAELVALTGGLEDARSGRGRLFLVAGEPGIGKSRLADELGARARERGARVLWGRCWEAGGAPAYWPWVQVLRALVRDRDPEALRVDLGAGATDVAQIVPELRDLLPDLPEPPGVDPESARFRLFDATARFLVAAANADGLVLLLDDLHAADAPSLLLLRFLATELAESHLLVIGGYRDPSVNRDHPLNAAVADLARAPVTRRIHLGGLARDDVARYIERSTGARPSDRLVAAVHEETEGNPLFLVEVVRLIAHEGRIEADEAAARTTPIPEGVREVIGRRLAHLGGDAIEVLTLASVLGREFDLEILGALAGRSASEMLDVLEEAVAARIVIDVPGTPGRLRFGHALIRETLYDDLAPTRRLQLHSRVGEALEDLHAADPGPHLTELAHHFVLAAPADDGERAVRYARLAGDRAVSLLAYEEAARLYRLALRAAGQRAGDPRSRCELMLALGDVQMKAGDAAGSKATFLEAGRLSRAHGLPEHLARAALGHGGRFVWLRAGRDRDVVRLLEEALTALPEEDSELRVRLLARLAGALRDQPSSEVRDALSGRAVEMARRLEDPSTEAYALAGRYACIWGPDNTEELLGIADRIVELAELVNEPERALEGHLVRHTSLMILGDIPGAKAALDRAGSLAEELRQVLQRWYVACYRTILGLFEGRYREAEARIEETLALGERAQDLDPQVAYRLQLFALRREQGRLQEMEDVIRRSIDEYPWYPLFRCALAHLHAVTGHEHQARGSFEELAATDFASIPRDNQWLLAMTLLPEVARFLGDVRRAAVLQDLLLPYAELNVLFAPEVVTGSVAGALAVAAETAGRWDLAETHFEEAIARNERMGALPARARAQHDYARALLARDGPGDRDRAVELLGAAVATADELGMADLASRARSLEEAGAGVAARSPNAQQRHVFRREGEYWSIVFEGDRFRLRDTKGLRYLARLLREPGREFHALDLVASSSAERQPARQEGLDTVRPAGAGEILDRQARDAYRDRIEELRETLAVSESWNDPETAARAREEIDFLARELAGGVGLGGRPRPAVSPAERARQSATKAIKGALSRVAEHSPKLRDHLSSTVRTGMYCSYAPDPRVPISWAT
jgi:tetratricopeptide (TPR) repeat protein